MDTSSFGKSLSSQKRKSAPFEEQSRFLISFNQSNSLIGILTLLGVLQYLACSSVNANLVRGASTFDVE